jgi:predicted ATPase
VRRAIRTIHGRGFRFVAPVHNEGVIARDSAASTASGQALTPETLAASGSATRLDQSKPRNGPDIARTLRHPEFPFTGRAAELDALLSAWRRVVTDGQRLLLVAGAAGMGKTRLVAELAKRVQPEAAHLLIGRCDEEMRVPYQPFVDALVQFVDASPRHRLLEQLGHCGGELVHLLPKLGQQVAGLTPSHAADAETERYRLFAAAADWLANISRDGPVLLVLEDLHYATRETVLLLRHVARSIDPTARLLIIASYRGTELPRAHPLRGLLAELETAARMQRITLSGLDVESVRTFLAARAGQDLDETGGALARALHGYSQGNPFLIGQIVQHLGKSDALRHGRWVNDVSIENRGVPSGIRALVDRRLNLLSDVAKQVLRAAAVIGRDFPVKVLAGVVSLGADQLLSALDDAATARLVKETGPGSYRFTHQLVHAALTDELGATRRAFLRRRVQETIDAINRNS